MLHLFALALALPVAAEARNQVTTISVGDRLAHREALRSGVRRYVRYLVKPDGGRQLVDLWQRRVERGTLPDGRSGLHMVQRWDSVRDGSVLEQDSWFDAASLAPVTHVRRLTRDGKTTVSGFRFGDDAVTAMPDLAGSTNAGFRMATPERPFNFEYDMELFETLALAPGRIFDIPFYDAGIDKSPERYRFAVEGSGVVAGWDGRPEDCWILAGDYRTGKVMNRFWISKRGQVLLREEGPGPNGTRLVKSLLPPEAEDASEAKNASMSIAAPASGT